MTHITLVRGDQNYYLEFEVKDSDGEIVDLTGSTITFSVQEYGQPSLLIDHKVGEVIDGTLGLCRVFIGTEFSNVEGEYCGELQINFPGDKILTAPNIFIKVIKDLPK